MHEKVLEIADQLKSSGIFVDIELPDTYFPMYCVKHGAICDKCSYVLHLSDTDFLCEIYEMDGAIRAYWSRPEKTIFPDRLTSRLSRLQYVWNQYKFEKVLDSLPFYIQSRLLFHIDIFTQEYK